MWWMRISVVPAQGPPTRPPFARNSLMIWVLQSLPSPAAGLVMTCSARCHWLWYSSWGGIPQPGPVALVAAVGCPVEDRVVAHEELGPAGPGRVGLVDGVIEGSYDSASECGGEVQELLLRVTMGTWKR